MSARFLIVTNSTRYSLIDKREYLIIDAADSNNDIIIAGISLFEHNDVICIPLDPVVRPKYCPIALEVQHGFADGLKISEHTYARWVGEHCDVLTAEQLAEDIAKCYTSTNVDTTSPAAGPSADISPFGGEMAPAYVSGYNHGAPKPDKLVMHVVRCDGADIADSLNTYHVPPTHVKIHLLDDIVFVTDETRERVMITTVTSEIPAGSEVVITREIEDDENYDIAVAEVVANMGLTTRRREWIFGEDTVLNAVRKLNLRDTVVDITADNKVSRHIREELRM